MVVLFAVHFYSVLILLSADLTAQGLLRSRHKYTNIENVLIARFLAVERRTAAARPTTVSLVLQCSRKAHHIQQEVRTN